jgi:ribosomally synthesized peptide (two-chain TOMM family)
MAARKKKVKLSPPKVHHPAGFIGEDPQSALDLQDRWKIIWPAAVAQAWVDKEFKAALLKDAAAAIADKFDFLIPPALNVVVIDALKQSAADSVSDARPVNVPKMFFDEKKKKWIFPHHTTTLFIVLPTPPEGQKDMPVALAAYVGEGFGDGFTCCC